MTAKEGSSIEKDRRADGRESSTESRAEMAEVQRQALWRLIEFFKIDAVTASLIERGAIFAAG